ncbi:hypothetical protein Ssed_3004 [Shewanella sediminis HAW-EB3]|uniref:Sulfotransferase domain-containing protein n=1 Tax=Shewanella sediminis (strain HAW-EB3) TaxID=425104 RepID=A8FXN5_SHESH|nr:hypothetical protein [Shewanella sediminis]ABV37608.1 hypothetical protein Ssed_3004 [Shewanella sediminis HAW-EB3]
MTNKKTVYFHIGYHKTGTSAIQSFCSANQSELARKGFLYAETGRAGAAHGPLANCLKASNKNLDPNLLYASLKKEIANSNAQSVIISSECFLEQIPLDRIEPYLKKLNAHIKIIVYVRRQDEWAQSVYNEIIKDSSRRYTGSILHMREIRMGWLNYNNVISQWENVFGSENIIVRPYDKAQMRNGLYADFLSIFNIDNVCDFENPVTGKATNQGLSEDVILVLRALNEVPMIRDMHKEMVSYLIDISHNSEEKKLGRNYKILTFSEKSELISSCKQSNDILAEKFLNCNTSLFCTTLVENKDDKSPVEMLSIERQWQIYNQLPLHIKKHIERFRPLFAQSEQSKPFVYDVNNNEIERLRLVIQRQRLELNWLYEDNTLGSIRKEGLGVLSKFFAKLFK